MTDSILKQSFTFFWKDILGDFFAFPLWWYSTGTVRVITIIMNQAGRFAASLSLRIWVKNLFVPMYAQYDVAGRIISFVLRIVVLIYRFVLFIVWLIILLAFLGAWLFGPIAVVVYIVYQIFGISMRL